MHKKESVFRDQKAYYRSGPEPDPLTEGFCKCRASCVQDAQYDITMAMTENEYFGKVKISFQLIRE